MDRVRLRDMWQHEREHPGLAAMMATPNRFFTQRRIDQVRDPEWYCSTVVTEHLCVSELDDNLNAIVRLDNDGWIIGMGMYRDQRDRTPFTRREQALMHLLHRGLEPIYRSYARRMERNRNGLSPRMQETLKHLLTGASEKEIARRMYRSRHTVHDYVKALHRHFNVSSRAELSAHCLGRGGMNNGVMPDERQVRRRHKRPRLLVTGPEADSDANG